ncbi:DUF6037 family protein [Shewanella benthica]|uniref:DUF6037 family protein n=1 Tax=Shewanella benthica TaxID=43661 RepID=UPI00187A024F|nr:DUF6037 family protein [Shewanella benthica]MBE7215185.1 hypothetical protein [Shewanella benthica]MCL1062301.1 DUF6037 family protein [Shewanella benthica]
MSVFDNFRLLKEDMVDNGWVIDAFPFKYKNYDYIVLAKLYQDNERIPQFALMKTKIMRRDDVSINITIPVNVNGFIIRTQELREFFGIEYTPNLGEILKQFTENFATFIPPKVTLNKPDWLKDPMVGDLSSSDSENPNRLFCFNVRRNGTNRNRTPFNDNKTRLLRPNLYSLFCDDQTVSFCYSSESEQEETDEEILAKFSRR